MATEYAINDYKKESTKECLNCYEKHLGESIILLGEISDRFVGKLDPSDTHVEQDISDAMKELGAAEKHVQQVTDTNPERVSILKSFGAAAREMRGMLRDFRESYPVLDKNERISIINNIQNKAVQLDKDIRNEIKTNGCGDCQQISEEYTKELRTKILPYLNSNIKSEEKTNITKTIVKEKNIMNKKDNVDRESLNVIEKIKLDMKNNFNNNLFVKSARKTDEILFKPFRNEFSNTMKEIDIVELSKYAASSAGKFPILVTKDIIDTIFPTAKKR